jgi:S-adenosylmethionine hydrolase
MPIITLTTDFGTRDGYVGAMKGVLARLAPSATIVDVAHEIPRHDIAHGAWVLATASREFPPGTIHVAVVDPGVGGERAEVVARIADQLYVGPDNGLFAQLPPASEAWRITAPAFRRVDASATFHGRDVFAVAAARLACGEAPERAGPATRLTGRLPWDAPGAGRGHVVHVDHYGNLISDLVPGEARRIRFAGRELAIARTYEAVAIGEPVAYVGSAGTIEIAIRDGRADDAFAARRGLPVELA